MRDRVRQRESQTERDLDRERVRQRESHTERESDRERDRYSDGDRGARTEILIVHNYVLSAVPIPYQRDT